VSIQELQANYEFIRPFAIRFADRLAEQLRELLDAEGISLAVPIESRVKTWESIQNKVERNHLEIKTISELGDLVGLRLILLFVRDVRRVISLLHKTLEVISTDDTGERLGDSQFGYQSVHLKLKLPQSWLTIPTFKGLGEMMAEVQVRTASQHIWAAASHVLQYKQEAAVPLPVRRSINRVAALLETVDLELERTLRERADYSENLDITTEDKQLDVDVLRAVLSDVISDSRYKPADPYGELLAELFDYSITTVGALRDFISANLAEAEKRDKEDVAALKERGRLVDGQLVVKGDGMTITGDPHLVRKGVFKTRVGLVRDMLFHALQEKTRKQRRPKNG